MKNIIKTSVLAALLAVSAQASAKTATFDLNFIATNNYGTTSNSVGTVTMTDLSDLNLGDSASGVRVTVSLNNLNQFSSGNTGAVWISSYEMNFAGTGLLGDDNVRHVAGLNTSNIEWEEDGCVGYGSSCGSPQQGWGGDPDDEAWGQEVNFSTSTFTNGQFSTIDYLNGGIAGYNGFSVDQFLANAVSNNGDSNAPDAYFWIRIRGNTVANGGGMADSGYWGNSIANISTVNGQQVPSSLNYRLNVLATTYTISAVPETETYAMFLAGLGMMGAIVRRRRSA